MTNKEQLEMWEKLHGCNWESHFERARKIVDSWPKWKRECAYSTSSDRYLETDSGARHRR